MKSHQYPEPWWAPDGTIEYAPNAKEAEKLKAQGYRNTVVGKTFPMALHGGIYNGIPQSLSVKNEDELQRALANGWKMKPFVEESPETHLPSPDQPPMGFDITVQPEEVEMVGVGESTKRKPGRPPKEAPAA